MREENVDILSDEILLKADAICFTSNGIVKSNNELVMGAGVAKAFKNRFPIVPKSAGDLVKKNGNICQVVKTMKFAGPKEDVSNTFSIVAFPTKNDWKDKSDLNLIITSAKQLISMADNHGWNKIYLPKPGCLNGQLNWETQVKSAIKDILDDRVIICHL